MGKDIKRIRIPKVKEVNKATPKAGFSVLGNGRCGEDTTGDRGQRSPRQPCQLLCEAVNTVHLFQDRICAFLASLLCPHAPLVFRKNRPVTIDIFMLPAYIILYHYHAKQLKCIMSFTPHIIPVK